jgi:hypothetical protein
MGGIGNYMASIFGGMGGGKTTTTNGTTSATPMPTHAILSPGGTGSMLGGLTAPPYYTTTGTQSGYSSKDIELQQKLENLKGYVSMCGDTLEYVYMDKMMETKDPKISVLKLATDGEFIKNVGLKFNEKTYYIIREKE